MDSRSHRGVPTRRGVLAPLAGCAPRVLDAHRSSDTSEVDHPRRVPPTGHPGVLMSLAAAATALLATAGVLVDRGTLAPPLALVPAVLTILLMTLGAGLAAITVSAAWQGRGATMSRSRRGSNHTESAGSPAGPT